MRSADSAQTPTTASNGSRSNLNADQQVQTGIIEQDQQPSTSQPDSVIPDAGSADAGSPDADAGSADAARQDAGGPDAAAAPGTVTTTIPAGDLTATTVSPQLTTTTPSEPAQRTTTVQAVVAINDELQLTVGQTVDFDVLANDGPATSIDSVLWISGLVEGLTLGEDGRLTGSPTEAGADVIFYRLIGNNDTFDTGQIRVVVE